MLAVLGFMVYVLYTSPCPPTFTFLWFYPSLQFRIYLFISRVPFPPAQLPRAGTSQLSRLLSPQLKTQLAVRRCTLVAGMSIFLYD